jgi:hypothetical protein
MGSSHWAQGQVEEALAALRQAVEVQRQVVARAPEVASSRQCLGERHVKLGRKLCELGRLEEAEASFREQQQLWPGDPAKQAEVLGELQKWAAEVGDRGKDLSPGEQLERQRYLDLRARLARPAALLEG